MIARRLPDGWAAWPLLLASAATLAGLGHYADTMLTGGADGYIGIFPPPVGRELIADRWSAMWGNPSPSFLLVWALLPLLVLSAAVVVGRPAPLVLRGSARWPGVLLAGVTALAGVAGVAGFGAQLVGVLPVTTWSSVNASVLDAFSPAACAVLVTAVLAVVVTAVLARGVDEALDGDEADGEPVVDEPVAEPCATEVPVTPVPVPAGPPTLRPEDAARYRRP